MLEYRWASKNELLHMDTNIGEPAKTYIYQLCADTGCCLEDLPREMIDRDRW